MTNNTQPRQRSKVVNLVAVFLAVVAAGGLLAPSASSAEEAERQPYANSKYKMEITDWYNKTESGGLGSDNWAVTWMDADRQLATFGDGNGFNSGSTKCSAGVSLLTTNVRPLRWNARGKDQWNGRDVACTPEGRVNGGLPPGKSYGILAANDGKIYMWLSPNSINTEGEDNFDSAELYVSNNRGANWSSTGVRFTDNQHKLGLPTFLQFGPGYRGYPKAALGTKNGQPYVYMYFVGITNKLRGGPGIETAIQNTAQLQYSRGRKGGQIYLARVPINKLHKQNEYEWFSGFHQSGNPLFRLNFGSRKPVFEDPNGVGWTVSAAYNQGLRRVMLVTEHSKSATGRIGVFASTRPWGSARGVTNERLRWRTVHYESRASSGFFWNFSNRWTQPNGLKSTLIWSGTGTNDRLQVSTVTFSNRS